MTEVIDIVDVIGAAIVRRHRLEIDYPPGKRIVEPHVLGRSREGNLLLRAFQTSGASASGEHHNWKLFRVDRMGTVHDTGEKFAGPRPQYNPDDSAMKGGIIERI